MSDLQIEKIIEILKKTKISNYYIAKYTGISQASIGNWKRGDKKPSKANALILKHFFEEESKKTNKKSTTQSIVGNHNKMAGRDIDNSEALSDIIEDLKSQLKTKDSFIDNLLKQQEILINQINKLTDKIK